jgi:glutaminyl-tRNA synthetase
MTNDTTSTSNFIRNRIIEDIKANKNSGQVMTRFPPEPNGYLHIGHAKSICLNFGVSAEFNGQCNLRFDDSNPVKEDIEYVESIKADVHWLGFQWAKLCHASDYFEELYQYAIQLIQTGKAYVDDLSTEEIREYRGTLTQPGNPSPFRDRPIDKNLELFQRMRAGEFEEGTHVLRAKIDMASPNLNMRDPVIYRIRHATHHQTGDKWCIYPMYDYTHCISDAIEGITHSLCTLEFEDHRPLYDWFLDELQTPCHPQQIEFARLSLEYTVMSKRKLQQMVEQGYVDGWDDPRMPTLSGIRRRGYTPEAIRAFSDSIGITKKDSFIELGMLENCIREDLNERAARVMAVLRPLRVVIDNYPEDLVEEIDAPNHPNRLELGVRKIAFSRTIYIESDDFREKPPKNFFRLAPGREVRLRYAYYITCTDIKKDDQGNIIELRCTYDPASKGGSSPDGRKVKGTIHWVSAAQAVDATVHLYDRLFSVPNPAADSDFIQHLNPHSLDVLTHCKLEPSLASATPGICYQFERLGYFCLDPKYSHSGVLTFNRTATLRDTWAKIEKAQKLGQGA